MDQLFCEPKEQEKTPESLWSALPTCTSLKAAESTDAALNNKKLVEFGFGFSCQWMWWNVECLHSGKLTNSRHLHFSGIYQETMGFSVAMLLHRGCFTKKTQTKVVLQQPWKFRASKWCFFSRIIFPASNFSVEKQHRVKCNRRVAPDTVLGGFDQWKIRRLGWNSSTLWYSCGWWWSDQWICMDLLLYLLGYMSNISLDLCPQSLKFWSTWIAVS